MKTDRINLLARKKKTSRSISFSLNSVSLKSLPREALVMIAVCIVFVSVAALTGLKYQAVQRERAALALLQSSLQATKSQILQIRSVAAPTQAAGRLTLVKEFVENRRFISDVLKEISLVTPADVWLTGLTTKREEGKEVITLTAEALSTELMSQLLTSLEASYFLREARLKLSEQLDGTRPAVQRFQFDAVIDEKYLGPLAKGHP